LPAERVVSGCGSRREWPLRSNGTKHRHQIDPVRAYDAGISSPVASPFYQGRRGRPNGLVLSNAPLPSQVDVGGAVAKIKKPGRGSKLAQ
jgi:hypothetical protein